MNDVQAAKILIKSIDLTSLNDSDNEYKIEKLCQQSKTLYGHVASVCVYPKFVSLAKSLLSNNGVKVATVINFPEGGNNINHVINELEGALRNGADEIDAVFPYRAFLENNWIVVDNFLHVVNKSEKHYTSKIILETGEISKSTKIIEATRLCLESGATFIKTSTGTTPISATPEAANLILETISTYPKKAGFKASGGIKTIDDAKKYLILAEAIMGYKWVSPKTFRIGASSLLDNLLGVIECSLKK